MNSEQFSELLEKLRACKDAVKWAKNKSFKEVWETCHRGDWMLWLSMKMMDKDGWGDLRNLTAAKVKCARLVQHLMKDERSLKALDVAQAFSEGRATLEEMNNAAVSAAAAADYAAAAAADYAAAADAASAAANAALADAYTAYIEASADYNADDADAEAEAEAAYLNADDADEADACAAYAAAKKAKREEVLMQCADICREILIVPIN